jgi:hypothetical protein
MRISILLEALTGTFETDIQRARKRMDREMRNMQRAAQRAGRIIAAAVVASAAAFATLIARTTRSTDEMIKFGHRLGLTANEMRRLQFVADRTGTNVNSFANAMQRLTRNLADARDGAGPAAGALERLGLSASELLGMGQDQAFFRIGQALKNVEDRGLQAQLAFQLLGREGQSLLGMINRSGDQFSEMAAQFDQFNLALSNLQANNIEQLSDTMSDVSTVIELARQRFVSGLAPAINEVIERLILARARTGDLGDAVDSMSRRFTIGTANALNSMARLVEVVERFPQSAQFGLIGLLLFGKKGAALGAALGAIDSQVRRIIRSMGVEVDDMSARIDQMNRQIARGRTDLIGERDALLAQLRAAQADGSFEDFFNDGPAQSFSNVLRETAQAIMDSLGREAPEAVKRSVEAMKSLADEAETVASGADKMIAALEQQVATLGFSDAAVQLYRLRLEGATDEQLRHAEALLESIDGHEALQSAMNEAGQVFEATRTPVERFNAEIERLNMLRDTFVNGAPLIDAETYRRAVEAAQDALDATEQVVDQWSVMMDELARSAARNIQSALADFLFDPFEDGLAGMLRSFSDTLRRMAAEAASQQILSALFSGSGGFGGFLSGMFGGGLPSRDMGGRGVAGQPYLIGTGAQPELFIPDTAGTFVPNAGGQNVSIYNNVTVQAPQGRLSRESDLQLRTSLASATNEGIRRGS